MRKSIFPVFIAIILFSSCVHLVRKPSYDISRYESSYADEPVLFCYYFQREHFTGTACAPLVFFPDGSLLHGPTFLVEDKNAFTNWGEYLYIKSSTRAGWGRYKIQNDTIFYQYTKYLNLGGSPWLPKISRIAVEISTDSLLTKPKYIHKKIPINYRPNDTLIYVRADYPDILNIDPDLAWINQ